MKIEKKSSQSLRENSISISHSVAIQVKVYYKSNTTEEGNQTSASSTQGKHHWTFRWCILLCKKLPFSNNRYILFNGECNIIIKVVTPAGSTQRYYISGNTGKHGKVEVKRKLWVLAQPPYFQQEKREQSPRVEQKGDRPPDVEENPGSQYH